eukprot:6197904-Pleurochrysis_carterae.AAC.2
MGGLGDTPLIEGSAATAPLARCRSGVELRAGGAGIHDYSDENWAALSDGESQRGVLLELLRDSRARRAVATDCVRVRGVCASAERASA